LPWGRPGIGLEMDGAMQQAAQPGRQFMPGICRRPRAPGRSPPARRRGWRRW
jgi:hypothetical protein